MPALSPAQLIAGFLLAALVGAAGWKLRALTPSGAVGATLIGGTVFGVGGLFWAVVLVAFFAASSLLSRLGYARKQGNAQVEKAGPRDLAQTLANGGVALVAALLTAFFPRGSAGYPYLALGFLGAMAAATADTWATEIGLLSSRQPRLITTGRPVPAGVSGGVTPLGLLGSLAGGTFIGLVAFVAVQGASLLTTGEWFLSDWFLLLVLPAAGFLASLFDSFLGATAQRLYYCERCQTATEQPVHHCGASARPVRGFSWMNNDMVNFLATCVGALAAILLSQPFLPS
jgi:uncharacterized protein (TIGR00297 family)